MMNKKSFLMDITIVVLGLIAGLTLGSFTGKDNSSEEETAPEETVVFVEKCLSDWDVLKMAIIKTESEFNPKAEGSSRDKGIFQITHIYVEDVNRIVHLKKLDKGPYTHLDAFDVEKSLEMFDIMQDYYNPEHSLEKAIYLHNPGGESIGYPRKVKKNMEFIRNLEEVRKSL